MLARSSSANKYNEEIIETQGGSSTLLKRWKAQYGSDEIEFRLAHS
ncbi:hypothetical protein [Pseudomonas sp. NPDC086251]